MKYSVYEDKWGNFGIQTDPNGYTWEEAVYHLDTLVYINGVRTS